MDRAIYTFQCRNCNNYSTLWSKNCPVCDRDGALVPVTEEQPIVIKKKTLADAKPLTGIRISTGIEGFDRVLGRSWRTNQNGIHIPSTVLFAGAAGVGKSTLLMRMAASVKTEKFLYLSTEQTVDEIRDNAERCGLSEADLVRIIAMRITDLSEAVSAMKEHKSKVVVLDSLNELVDPKNDTGDTHANLIRSTTAFKLDAEENKRGILMITHMNKKEEIAGVQRIQHIVSAVMRIEKRGQLRVVHCPDKNRFGSTSEKAYFRMTERGMEEAAAPETREVEAHEENNEKRRFRNHVKD